MVQHNANKEVARRLLAREIHSNAPLMAELEAIGNPEKELNTYEKKSMQ